MCGEPWDVTLEASLFTQWSGFLQWDGPREREGPAQTSTKTKCRTEIGWASVQNAPFNQMHYYEWVLSIFYWLIDIM